MGLFLHIYISSLSFNKSGRYTHVKGVPRHATALALFVPVRFLTAGVEEVSRQAAVVAVLIGTFADPVAWGATKEAGLQLLHTHAHIPPLVVLRTCTHQCVKAVHATVH